MLKALDGWKLVIGFVILLATQVYDAMSGGQTSGLALGFLQAVGWDAVAGQVNWPLLVGNVVAAAGVGHKLWKAGMQIKAGAAFTDVLSTAGYKALPDKN